MAIAEMKTEHEDGDFIEGFGIPMINGKKPFTFGNQEISNDINIKLVHHEIDSECEELN